MLVTKFCSPKLGIPACVQLPFSHTIKPKQGLTLTLTCSPLESKVDSVESEKFQLRKNTSLIRKIVFYSLERSFWLVEN